MDIKVRVSGSNSDRITLSWVLFGDVAAHQLSKGDLIQEVKALGFRRIDMTDGYDYHVYWNLE